MASTSASDCVIHFEGVENDDYTTFTPQNIIKINECAALWLATDKYPEKSVAETIIALN